MSFKYTRISLKAFLTGALFLSGCSGDYLDGPDLNPFDPLSSNYSNLELVGEFDITLGSLIPSQVAVSDSGHVYILWTDGINGRIVKYSSTGEILIEKVFDAPDSPMGIRWTYGELHVWMTTDYLSNPATEVVGLNSMLEETSNVHFLPINYGGNFQAWTRNGMLADNGRIYISYATNVTTAALADSLNRLINISDYSGVILDHIDVNTSNIPVTYDELWIESVAVDVTETVYILVNVDTGMDAEPRPYTIAYDDNGNYLGTWELDWHVYGAGNFTSSNLYPVDFSDQGYLTVPAGSQLLVTNNGEILSTVDTGVNSTQFGWLDITYSRSSKVLHAITELSDSIGGLGSYSFRMFQYDW
jgi:hypothetical protein